MELTDLDLKRVLSFEEVKHFFSKCNEYDVTKHDDFGNIKISMPNYGLKTIIYEPTMQTLIRDIYGLGYLRCANKAQYSAV